ncbi:MAG: T9SS type A sorting domain-containing protein [Flavobacteriales bacterium]
MKKHLLTLLAAVFCSVVGTAQVVAISIEPVYTDDGTITGYPAGHTTYRIYADVTNPGDMVLNVVGFNEAPLALNVPDGIWNHPEPSGTIATDNNCNLYGVFPALEYDSYVTIGRTCNTDPGGLMFAVEDPAQPWRASFDTNPVGNGNILLNTTVGGAWNSTPNEPNGTPYINVVAGDDYRVLIAQITTTGSICGSFNVQCRLQGQSSGSTLYTGLAFGTGGCGEPGCTDEAALNYNPSAGFNNGTCLYECALTMTTESIDPLCFGQNNGSIVINLSGNQDITEVEIPGVNSGNAFVVNGSYEYANIGEGIYQITARDRRFYNESFNPGGVYGECEVTEFVELYTAPIIFGGVDVTNISCGGDQDGCAIADVTGGNGTLSIYIVDAIAEAYLLDENGDALMLPSADYCGLPAGEYYFEAYDENLCMAASEVFVVESPATLNILLGSSADATCFNSADATQVITWSGGTGDVDWSLEDDNTYTLEGGPSTLVLNDLTPGTYMIYAQDVNGCTAELQFVVEGGPAITFEYFVTGPTCTGDNDATVIVAAAGGTGALSYDFGCTGTFSDTELYAPVAVGAYTVCVEDAQGCSASFDVVVEDTPAVAATASASAISCNGEVDGGLTVNATGGTAPYTYSIDGESYQNANTFEGLAAGSYSIYVLDNNGCFFAAEQAAEVVEPAVLVVSLDDFGGDGGNNTGFINVSVSGGTPEFTFAWANDNGFTSASEDVTGLAVGTYTLTVTDASGCIASLTENVTITNVEELVDGVSITVNPNPTTGKFFLNMEGLSGQKVEYNILDTQGRLVVSKELGNNSGQRLEQIDITDVAAGIYYIQLNIADSTSTIKLIKN